VGNEMKITNLTLILSCVTFLILSVVLYKQVATINAHCDVDSTAYIQDGKHFYKNSSFCNLGKMPYYSLGYPLIIGLIYKLFGENNLTIILLQILISLLSLFLIFKTTQKLFGHTTAIISTALFSINIGYLTFSQFILTEILLSLFLLLFFERFLQFLETKNLSNLAAAGLSLGISIFVKPAAIYYPIFLAPIFYFTAKNTVKSVKLLLLFLLTLSLPVAGYIIHNKIVLGQFHLGAYGDVNSYFWLLPNVLSETNATNSDIERIKLQRIDQQLGREAVKQIFVNTLQKHPITFVYVIAKNVLKTFLGLFSTNLKVLVENNTGGGDISFFKSTGTILDKIKAYICMGTTKAWVKAVATYEFIWQSLRYILCLLALIFLFSKQRFAILYFFLSYIFYFSMITGHDGCARFRMMFEFSLIILAAMGIYIIANQIFNKQILQNYDDGPDVASKDNSPGIISK
jgi:hypothetical protein